MKLSWKQIEPFVKSPDPAARVILVYGPDNGLMRERARTMGNTIVADLNDPFNAVTLSGDALLDDPARLADEASAMSMMGGGRLIRIEDGGDKLAPLLKEYLESPSDQNLVIIEAGELGPKSALRALCEKAKNAAAVPCYVEDERSIAGLIRESVQAEGYTIAGDAVSWLAGAIVGDRGRARSEIEKLILFMGEDKQITLDAVQTCCGEAGAQSMDNLVYSVGGKNPAAALKAYATLMDEGIPAVAILRALQNHFRRLHMVKARLQEGEDIGSALKTLSPPLFFKFEDPFKAQLGRWSMPLLEKTLMRLAQIEAQTKQTGTPVETLCGQAILGLSK
ncbi:MAG: DNA polymerase III subunit delta [Rhodospirillales bacterium]|nr:DNA polymerase III subunit delta [Rhodospirillales bacterium]MCB9997025.1 DNA polymerase III subunit delta [Rhodospirillales bacterium]